MRVVILSVAVLTTVAATGAAAQEGVVPPLDPFYPVQRLQPSDPEERRICGQVLSATPAGDPEIVVAAYADRTNGVIRVLRRSPAGTLEPVADSPAAWALPGTRTRCVVRLNDLDFDGQPEVFVTFEGTRASVGWVVRWDGVRLLNLTPTHTADGRAQSLLLNPVVYDLEHRGSLRVVAARDFASPPPGVPASHPAYVYRLGPAALEVEASLLAIMGFRADVNPASNLRTFRVVTDSAAPYTVRIVNGDREGRRRVSGTVLTMNNAPMISSEQVHAGVEFATTTLPSLFVQNHVTATLSGAPDAYILVLVQDSTRR